MPLDEEVASRLDDIVDACSAIAEYVQAIDFDRFAATRLTRAAVERELITIGEAVGAILRLDPSLESQITDARGIVDLRNCSSTAIANSTRARCGPSPSSKCPCS